MAAFRVRTRAKDPPLQQTCLMARPCRARAHAHIVMHMPIHRTMVTFVCVFVLALTAAARPARAQSDQADRVRNAGTALSEIMAASDKAIPSSILEKAEAIAVFPGTIKGAFIVGAQRGHGIMSVRNANAGGWSLPAFLTITGGSFGLQIGGQAVDIVLVVM